MFILTTLGCNRDSVLMNALIGKRSAVQPEAKSDNLITPIPTEPTNPFGGQVDARRPTHDAKENLLRVNRNISQPIVFGQSAANISFSTSQPKSWDILSDPLGTDNNGIFYYKENIAVAWSLFSPFFVNGIWILPGYEGYLTLPSEYGSIKVGDSLTQLFENDLTGRDIARQWYRFFENQDPSYDCVKNITCTVVSNESSITMTFARGIIFFSKTDDQIVLQQIAITPPLRGPQTPVLDDPVVFGSGAGGASLTMDPTLEFLDFAIAQEGLIAYDNNNLFIDWVLDTPSEKYKPKSIIVTDLYDGKINLGTIGSDLSLYQSSWSIKFTETDPHGYNFSRDLGKEFLTGAPEDCISQLNCAVFKGNDLIRFDVKDIGSIYFSDDANKTIVLVESTLVEIEKGNCSGNGDLINKSITCNGQNINSVLQKSTLEAAIGEPVVDESNEWHTYGIQNDLWIKWSDYTSPTATPLALKMLDTYAGPITVSAELGNNIVMGQNFSTYFEDNNGDDLIIALGKHIFQNTDNCLTESTCSIAASTSGIKFEFSSKNTAFFFIKNGILETIEINDFL